MGHFRIDMVGVLHDALGFSVRRFDDVLRVAWLPLLFIALSPLAWQQLVMAGTPQPLVVILSLLVPLLLTASYMVPLTRMAALGERASPRSLQLPFGGTQIQFALVSFVSVLTALLVAVGPTNLGINLTNELIREIAVQEVFVFDEGSLHGGEVNVLFADVTPLQNFQLLLQWVVMPLILFYAGIRLFLWPFAIAAGAGAPLGLALRASAGANGIRLFLIFLTLGLVQVVVSFGSGIAVGAGRWVGGLLTMTISTLDNFGFSGFGWIENVGHAAGVGISYLLGIVVSALTAGLVAGAAGSVIAASSRP